MVSHTLWTVAILSALCGPAAADSWTKIGCFSSSSVQSSLSYKDSYTFQSSGHCETQCQGQKIVALTKGNQCYCGNTAPSSSDQVDDSSCDTPCQGYPLENCGADSFFLLYSDGSVLALSSAAGSLASSLTSSTSKSSSSTKTSSSTSSSSSDSSETLASPDITTLVSTVTNNPSQSASTIHITKGALSSHATASSSGSAAPQDNQKTSSSHKTAPGTIVGAVVGSVGGVGVIAAIVGFFLWHRRRQDAEDHEDEFTLSGPEKDPNYHISPNPFTSGNGTAGAVAAAGMVPQNNNRYSHGQQASNANTLNSHSTSNHDEYFTFENNEYGDPATQDYGRRRLSDGSLPDMVQRNPGSLKVVNN